MNFIKKSAAFLLCAILLCSVYTISTAAANETGEGADVTVKDYITGDVNGDGKVTMQDILALQKHLAKSVLIPQDVLIHANLAADGAITIAEVTNLQKVIAAMAPSYENDGEEQLGGGESAAAVETLKLLTRAANLFIGSTVTLKAVILPEDAGNKTIQYTSSDQTVASVDENGKVTALAQGEALITAQSRDGGKTDTCTITVMPKSTLNFSGFKSMPSGKIAAGASHTLAGTVRSNVALTSVTCRIAGTKMTKTLTYDASQAIKSCDIGKAFKSVINFAGLTAGSYTFEVLAADVQSTGSAKRLYAYTFTVYSNTLSSKLKTLTFEGKTYNVPNGYASSYLYDQRDYGKFVQYGQNVGCSATAEAIGASVLYGKTVSPTSAQIIWTSYGAGWGLATGRLYNCSVATKLNKAYTELINGKPTLLNTLNGSDHWVTIVGISSAADKNNLKTEDFLIANPWGGKLFNLKTYLNSTGRYIPNSYSLRTY